MKAAIDVKNRREGESIRAGLEDPAVRAFVIVMGTLRALPSDRARQRVLSFVADHMEERAAAEGAPAEA
jgi:hypothetical protein